MTAWLPRSAWGARASEGPAALRASEVDGYALHWPGMAKPINAAGETGKVRVASALRGWQAYHMDVRGWSDIAYMGAVDQAGRKWTLRGINIKSGANGDADVNRRFGAFLLILAPGEQPSAAMVRSAQEIGAEFCARFTGARRKPYGHKDVRPAGTDCPGPLAYAAIGRGEFTPGTTTSTGEDDMPYTEAQLRAMMQAEIEEYATRFWVAPTGTGTALRAQMERIEQTVNRIEDDTDDGTGA